jgi:hypothetical protein
METMTSSMRRILGVHCTPKCAFLAMLEGTALRPVPERLEWPAGEESERLAELFQDARSLVGEQAIERLAILLPERGGSFQQGYFAVAPRVAMETVLRLSATLAGVEVVMLQRPTVRTALGCGKQGGLEKHLGRVIPNPVGKYWNQGRGLAAMAAVAAERS